MVVTSTEIRDGEGETDGGPRGVAGMSGWTRPGIFVGWRSAGARSACGGQRRKNVCLSGQARRQVYARDDWDPKRWPLDACTVADPANGEARPMSGARNEARRLKTLLDQGIDPREQRDEERAARESRR